MPTNAFSAASSASAASSSVSGCATVEKYKKDMNDLQNENAKLLAEKGAQARERLHLREMLYRATNGLPIKHGYAASGGVAGNPGALAAGLPRTVAADELVSTSRYLV